MLYQFGQLGGPLASLGRGLLVWLGDLLRWQVNDPPADTTLLLLAWSELLNRSAAVLTRLGSWLTNLAMRQASYDPLATTLAWILCLWLVAVWASWHTFRRQNPLLGMVPAGVLLAGSLNYTRASPVTLVTLVGALLLLMAVVRYDSHEQRWTEQHIDFAEDIEMDTGILASAIVIGLMLVSLATPSLSWQAMVKFGREIFQPYRQSSAQVAESLGLEPAPGGQPGGGLPRRHLLGAGPELLRTVVMTIRTGELPPMATVEMLPRPPTRYYWRAVTYDLYTGQGWETSQTVSYSYRADEPALKDIPTDITTQQFIHQEVTLARDTGGQLFFTGFLITANRPYLVSWRAPAAQAADPFEVLLNITSRQARTYQASSIRTLASVEQLRAASGPIPEWLLARYLQLPETLPERVRQLALELAAPGAAAETPTSYDKASAIEAYLRTFPYTLDVSVPPADRDVTDYFLFDLQTGYCDYYATAMVVLARAVGLPARLVVGFASGSYDAPNAQYVVTEADSHSWVEIYFPGIGWVEFEPTAAQALIERPDRPELAFELPGLKPAGHAGWWEGLLTQHWDVFGWSIAGAVMLFVIFNLWLEIDHWWLLHQTPPVSIQRIYRRLVRRSRRLVQPLQPGATP
jgi:transglutaminase-like putative cysteine protease